MCCSRGYMCCPRGHMCCPRGHVCCSRGHMCCSRGYVCYFNEPRVFQGRCKAADKLPGHRSCVTWSGTLSHARLALLFWVSALVVALTTIRLQRLEPTHQCFQLWHFFSVTLVTVHPNIYCIKRVTHYSATRHCMSVTLYECDAVWVWHL